MSLDFAGRSGRVAELLDDTQARELARGESLALHDLGPAEDVALEEVEAEVLAGAQLLAGLDLLCYQLDAVRRASPTASASWAGRQLQDVELDYRDQLEERVVVPAPDVVVQGEGVAVQGQPAAPSKDLRVPRDVLQDLDHHLAWGEGDLVLADQERARSR